MHSGSPDDLGGAAPAAKVAHVDGKISETREKSQKSRNPDGLEECNFLISLQPTFLCFQIFKRAFNTLHARVCNGRIPL